METSNILRIYREENVVVKTFWAVRMCVSITYLDKCCKMSIQSQSSALTKLRTDRPKNLPVNKHLSRIVIIIILKSTREWVPESELLLAQRPLDSASRGFGDPGTSARKSCTSGSRTRASGPLATTRCSGTPAPRAATSARRYATSKIQGSFSHPSGLFSKHFVIVSWSFWIAFALFSIFFALTCPSQFWKMMRFDEK